jgi:2-alkyl-3-oxoalkanoate reductase
MSLIIAITGATGFVGRHVVPTLAAQGYIVRALLRDPAQKTGDMHSVIGDLDNETALDELCAGADVMLHMAGAINGLSTADFIQVNDVGTANVMAAVQRQAVRRVIYLSSLAAREPQISAYAASKRAGENHVSAAENCETLILRPAAVYGEGDKATLPLLKALMSWLAVIPGRLDSQFSMIHASDLAAVCAEAVVAKDTGLREVDDGNGGYAWADLISVTRKLYGFPRHVIYLPRTIAIVIGALGDFWAAIKRRPQMVSRSKMRELYFPSWVVQGQGWPRQQSIELESGLKRTIEWNMQSGALPRRGAVDRSPAEQMDRKL